MRSLIILVLCAFPSVVFPTGSSSSNTIQANAKRNPIVTKAKPLPFSSIVLFESRGIQLCLGVLFTPSKVLVSSTCHDQLLPRVDRQIEALLGITYGRFCHSNFVEHIKMDSRETPLPLSVVIIHRFMEYIRSKYESIVFIPEEIDHDFFILLLGAGIYNKETSLMEQFGLVPLNSDGSLLFAKSLIGRLPEHIVWRGALVFFLNRYVGILSDYCGERNGEFIYAIKTGSQRDNFLRTYDILPTFNEKIHDPLSPVQQPILP